MFKNEGMSVDDVYIDTDGVDSPMKLSASAHEGEVEVEYIKSKIEALGLSCPSDGMNSAMTEILHRLFMERDHWQNQTEHISGMCSTMKTKIDNLERQKEADAARITVLNQDVNAANEKMSALRAEQRELKCLWLSEKSELESRCFQLQALHTQLQGTLRKKERDYDRLQTQLSKAVKESQKPPRGGSGQQQGFTPVISISQPLKKNSSQSQATQGTLLDAELTAVRSTVATLEAENSNLREAVEELTVTFEEFQAKMTREVLEHTNSAPTNPDLFCGDDIENMSCLEQAKCVEQRLDATSAILGGRNSSEGMHTPNGSPRKALGVLATPGIGRRGIVGTPAARPMDWLVKQASTEVKALRERAEGLRWNIPQSNKENVENCGDDCADEVDVGKGMERARKYKLQLEEAMSVIFEQDRLIHAALVGNLSSVRDKDGAEYAEEDEDPELEYSEDTVFDLHTHSEAGLSGRTPGKMRSSYDPSDWSLGDILPAVSPDTMAVLKAANFTTLPTVTTTSEADGNQDGIDPVSLSMADEG